MKEIYNERNGLQSCFLCSGSQGTGKIRKTKKKKENKYENKYDNNDSNL
jgi:hypothetical protein